MGRAGGIVVGVLLTLGGCATAPAARAPEPDPVAAVEAYRDALVTGRLADAWDLIHPDARDGMDLAGFEALARRHRDALVEQAEALVALARSMPAESRAWVRADDRAAIELVQTPDGWRLTRPVGAVQGP